MLKKIDSAALENIAIGAAFLGSGGGGDPYLGRLMAASELKEHGEVPVHRLQDFDDDALFATVAFVGAPTIFCEKLPITEACLNVVPALENALGKKLSGIIPVEIGGLNSMAPIYAAAKLGLPLLDGDAMGRALPKIDMVTFTIYNEPSPVSTYANEHGEVIIINTPNSAHLERYVRALVVAMGGMLLTAQSAYTAEALRKSFIEGTMSLAERLGALLKSLRQQPGDRMSALLNFFDDTLYGKARCIFEGKIVDVLRRDDAGFSKGVVKLEPFEKNAAGLEIEFQNEHLCAMYGNELLAIVPDLICLLDHDTFLPITVEHMHYGQRVSVIAVRAPELMRTEAALKIVGPRAFGFKHSYQPLK